MPDMTDRSPALVADIGGTNIRFARVAADGRPRASLTLRAEDHAGIAEAVDAYLAATPDDPPPRPAALGGVSPAPGGRGKGRGAGWDRGGHAGVDLVGGEAVQN